MVLIPQAVGLEIPVTTNKYKSGAGVKGCDVIVNN